MNLRRKLIILVALLAIAFGTAYSGVVGFGGAVEPTAGACAICGDGVCAKSCENKYSCPRDCGGSGGGTTKSSGQTR